ncbi:MAG: sulfotransferase [Cyanobacteriota bacterium]|nr:sulfotransferase [Cyanobacteriota bacterium]
MSPQPARAKVFGIGLNKTGTTTLQECGKILGYRCSSCDRSLLDDVATRGDLSRVQRVVDQHDFFEDWPWPLIYRQLDHLYPGSKFILTVRQSTDTWLRSLRSHALRTSPRRHCRKLAYGYNYPQGHEQEHLDFYERHNQEVRTYFQNRPNDFIELCWENGDGFKELCTFLGCDIPQVPFPHANSARSNAVQPVKLIRNYGGIAMSRITKA